MRRFQKILPAFALGVVLAATAIPASAQVVIPPQPILDTVSLSVTVEDWVATETALVSLLVDAAGNTSDAANLRQEIIRAARAVTTEGEWRIVWLDRRPDDAGLERWQAELEARLPEAQLAGLGEKTRNASKPGLQIRVGRIAFDPTLAEREAAKGRLRSDVYIRVNEELARLSKAFPDREFRMMNISFMEQDFVPEPRFDRQVMQAEAAAVAVQPGVQDKLTLTAHVTLGAFALPPQP